MIMPLAGAVTGGLDFLKLRAALRCGYGDDARCGARARRCVRLREISDGGAEVWLIVAWVMFLIIRAMNAMKRKGSRASASRRDAGRHQAAHGNSRLAEKIRQWALAVGSRKLLAHRPRPLPIAATMPDAKICGITTPEALDAAIEGGARFVGL